MLDAPQQAHEIQNRIQVECLGQVGRRPGSTIRHAVEPSSGPADVLTPIAAITGSPQIAVTCPVRCLEVRLLKNADNIDGPAVDKVWPTLM